MTSEGIAVNPQSVPHGCVELPMLLVAHNFPPENLTGAQRPFRFAKYLRQCGYHAHVITGSAQDQYSPWKSVYPTTRPPRAFAAAASRLIRAMESYLPYHDQLPWVPQALAEARTALRRCAARIVLSTSPPLASHVTALLLHWRYGLKWVADFRDPLCGNPFRQKRFGGGYDAFFERLIVTYADAVIVNTDAAENAVRERYPHLAHKIHVIWNGYDPEDTIAPEPIPARPHVILLHAGTIYGGRHPGSLVNSLYRLFEQKRLDSSAIRLQLIGTIELHEPWAARSRFFEAVQGGWLHYNGELVPKDEVQRELAVADYLLLLDTNERGTGLQVPAKLFEYIRLGRPILAFTSSASPAERILAQSGIPHVCIYPTDPDEQIDEKVMRLLRMPVRNASPSTWFLNHFDGIRQAQYLADILNRIVQ